LRLDQEQQFASSPKMNYPQSLFCPLSKKIFRYPVIADDNSTYEECAIQDFCKKNGLDGLIASPVTGAQISCNTHPDAVTFDKVMAYLKEVPSAVFHQHDNYTTKSTIQVLSKAFSSTNKLICDHIDSRTLYESHDYTFSWMSEYLATVDLVNAKNLLDAFTDLEVGDFLEILIGSINQELLFEIVTYVEPRMKFEDSQLPHLVCLKTDNVEVVKTMAENGFKFNTRSIVKNRACYPIDCARNGSNNKIVSWLTENVH
jgi:hypothetical protein